MDTIRNWAFSICCASLAGGILNFFLPKNDLQKTFKTVFCVFLLCIVLTPISEINFNKLSFSGSVINDLDIEKEFEENDFALFSAEYIENELILSAKRILEEEQLIAEDILAKVNISEEGNININEFVLSLKSSEKADSVAENIYLETGIEPELRILEEE